MTPSEYAQEELALWEQALREQREVEMQLQEARKARARSRVQELLPQVHALTTRADLLLARAVNVKCTFRDHPFRAEAPSLLSDLPLGGDSR
jgi:hypothetical protein